MSEVVNSAACTSQMIEISYAVVRIQDKADVPELPELDHMCIACGKEFDDHIGLELHLQRNHNLLETWCYICGESGLFTAQLKSNHLKTHANERTLQRRAQTLMFVSCLHCGVLFQSKRTLQMHLRFSHSDKVRGGNHRLSELLVGGSECGSLRQPSEDIVVAETIANLEAKPRRKRNRNKKLWKCINCEEFYTYGEGQRSHYLEKHKDLLVSCTFCGMMFQSASGLSRHRRKCEFHDCAKKDVSGMEYVHLWQRVAADSIWKEKMIRECDPKIIETFLLSDKPLIDLLNHVPIPKRFS